MIKRLRLFSPLCVINILWFIVSKRKVKGKNKSNIKNVYAYYTTCF